MRIADWKKESSVGIYCRRVNVLYDPGAPSCHTAYSACAPSGYWVL